MSAFRMGMNETELRSLPELVWNGPTKGFRPDEAILHLGNPVNVQGSPDELYVTMKSGKVGHITLLWSGDEGSSEESCQTQFLQTLHWSHALFGSFAPYLEPRGGPDENETITKTEAGPDAYDVWRSNQQKDSPAHRTEWDALHHGNDVDVTIAKVWMQESGGDSLCEATSVTLEPPA